MDSLDLYHAVGGRDGCRQLSEAFYARVKRDPLLRPLFPGKSLRCAVNAFAAFLAQFFGGSPEDARERWWLSLRESHQRFKIGPREQQAWLSKMVEALDDVPLDEAVRLALCGLFERSSAYIVNTGPVLGELVRPNPSSRCLCTWELADSRVTASPWRRSQRRYTGRTHSSVLRGERAPDRRR